MISKEFFVSTMLKLQDFEEKVNKVDSALRELGDGNGLFISDISCLTIAILEEIFEDKTANWISYFVWEKDFLKELSPDDITDESGKPIPITSWGDVYDFLVSEMA